MRPAGALLLVGVLLAVGAVGLVSTAAAQPSDCVAPPKLHPTYAWVYRTNEGNRYVERIERDVRTATSSGVYNVTHYTFTEYENGSVRSFGRILRAGPGSDTPWGLLVREHWENQSGTRYRSLNQWHPPRNTVLEGAATCPGEQWFVETQHRRTSGQGGGPPNQQVANETWRVTVGNRTTVDVPAGTLDTLEIEALRAYDGWTVRTYWSPLARAPAKVEQGPYQAEPIRTIELANYTLNRAPAARITSDPVHPRVGDTLVLDARDSADAEGPITSYRWEIGNRTYEQPVVRLDLPREETMRVHLTVTDEQGRVGTTSRSVYVSPRYGGGVGVNGPTQAVRGEIVQLEVDAPFEPVRVRWRTGDTVVGDGPTYQFRMAGDTALQVDAIHPAGHVFTRNHTVRLEHTPDPANRSAEDRVLARGGDAIPPGATRTLAILDPLDGNLVQQTFQVRMLATVEATLLVDGEVVWQGRGDPAAGTNVTLDPGRHHLRLSSGDQEHRLNVTVGASLPGDPGTVNNESDGGQPQSTPWPAGLAVLVALACAVASRRSR